MAKETLLEKMSYEEAFAELEAIVAQLEEADQPLDEAMALFERGQSLSKHCGDLLDKAELKVQQLTEEGEIREME